VSDPNISEPFGINPDKTQLLRNPVVNNRALNYSNSGTGWSHGFEIYIKKANKPGSRDWFGWISYTWSQTFRNKNIYSTDYLDPGSRQQIVSPQEQRLRSLFPNSREFIYDFDVTHLLSMVYGWRVSQEWQFGGRWFYRTAYPYTPIVGDDGGQFKNPANNQIFWNPTYSNNPYSADYTNSRRQIPYHRLDIRIDRFLSYEWGFMNLYLELINIYVRRNKQDENFDTTRPYSRTNPLGSSDFYLFNTGKTISPFINIGLEVRF
jgi:hypothetical protein